jgi:uncharacterized membrane protein YagU involved in acid resistance
MAARKQILDLLIAGVVASLVGAVPMTAAMLTFKRVLPRWEQYALPPREITLEAANKAGVEELMRKEPQATLATGAAHFGFAAVTGSLYGALFSRLKLPVWMKGVFFSLVVWAGSYLGWLPALGFLPPATRHPRERNLLMIGSHLIWGVTTAYTAERMLE